MWQHKQEERELKRTEGDIIKNQRTLRKEMRDFENGKSYYSHSHFFFFCLPLGSYVAAQARRKSTQANRWRYYQESASCEKNNARL